jgi:long-chain acyl-CoA synthetase
VKSSVFLTGATGFLGMEVMARLLEKGDREVVALVRAADDVAAQERLNDVLAKLWRDPHALSRPGRGAVAGDVTSPGLGMTRARAAPSPRGGRTRSCTARPRSPSTCRSKTPRQINVEGTREIIGLARQAKNAGSPRSLHPRVDRVCGRITKGHVP